MPMITSAHIFSLSSLFIFLSQQCYSPSFAYERRSKQGISSKPALKHTEDKYFTTEDLSHITHSNKNKQSYVCD